MADIFGLAYAALVILGGAIGYFKAGSLPSLAAGVAFGVVNGYGAYTENNLILLAGSGVLGTIMGVRFYNSHKFMPAGLVFTLSALIFARSVLRALA